MSKPTNFDEAIALLAQPVPKKFIKTKPGKSKASYVSHTIVRQYLHYVFDYHTFETRDVHEYDVQKSSQKRGEYTVRKVAARVVLRVTLGDETRVYDGWGESDNEENPYKSAESDAVKRIAAMSFGLGLQLWAGEHYFLPEKLTKALSEATAEVPEQAQYGGDGDEAHAPEDGDAPAGDEVAAKRDQKADDPPEPSADDKLAAQFRVRFHAILSELGVPDEHKKIWLQDKQKVESTNDLPDSTKRGILTKLGQEGGRLQLLKGIRASVKNSGDDVDVSRYDETIEMLSEAA